MGWSRRLRAFDYSARFAIRKQLGIETKTLDELREPVPVDEYIALSALSTEYRPLMDNWICHAFQRCNGEVQEGHPS